MIPVPTAHVAGIPVEETIGMYGPALLLAFGATCTMVRVRLRRLRERWAARRPASAQSLR